MARYHLSLPPIVIPSQILEVELVPIEEPVPPEPEPEPIVIRSSAGDAFSVPTSTVAGTVLTELGYTGGVGNGTWSISGPEPFTTNRLLLELDPNNARLALLKAKNDWDDAALKTRTITIGVTEPEPVAGVTDTVEITVQPA